MSTLQTHSGDSRWRSLAILSLVFVTVLSATSSAEEVVSVSDSVYSQRVAPIFRRHCVECHGRDETERGLDLRSSVNVIAGSETGPVMIPGKSSASLLRQVLTKGAEPHMPPDGQLTAAEIATIETWIDAFDSQMDIPERVLSEQDRDHWSFQPVRRPSPPSVQDTSWPRSSIDRFILARMEAKQLRPSPPAHKLILLRRVYLDLIGLPPSPDEVSAFLEDDSEQAFDRVVDRLLASPRYGERWGRHWMDLARYADSGGFHNDLDRPFAWRYRDYVIQSWNEDKPYGRFIREQIAGDRLPDATLDTWIATGFCRQGASNDDNMGKTELALLKHRMDLMDDVISTTSNVFLGLTIGCARCHDHKYDPISQQDYYGFLAFFNSAERKQLLIDNFAADRPTLRPVKGKANTKNPFAMVFTDLGQQPTATRLLWRGNVQNEGPVVPASIPRVLAQRETEASRSWPKATPSRQTPRLEIANWIADPENPLTWRVMVNRLWHYHFGRGLVTTTSNFGRLGTVASHPELLDWLASELRDNGGSLKSLHRSIVTSAVYRQSSSSRPEGIAADPGNALWWRREKRRLEAEPLRDSILAVAGTLNLVQGGPGVKPRIRADLLVSSQRNKWPTVKQEGAAHWRRSVYVYVKRQLQLPMMELFDAPSTTHSCDRRRNSLVPTQALVLMNDEFMRDQASYMASRVARQAGDVPDEQVRYAVRLALSREPTTARTEDGVRFLAAQAAKLSDEGHSPEEAQRGALIDLCHVLMNLSEFAYVD